METDSNREAINTNFNRQARKDYKEMTLMQIATSDLTNSNEDIIIFTSSKLVEPDAEAQIVPYHMVDSRTIFMSTAKYRQRFVSVNGIAFDTATDEQKQSGLLEIIKNWTGSVKVAGTKQVTYDESI